MLLNPESGLGPIADAETLEDVGQVRLDRPLADCEPSRDLLVRQSTA